MHPVPVPYARPFTAIGTEAGAVNVISGLMVRVLELSVLLLPGVDPLPVSVTAKLKVGVPEPVMSALVH
jgi:hypothetical protein